MNICKYCLAETKNKMYCSRQCNGFDLRGKPRGERNAEFGTAKNHIRISVNDGMFGKKTDLFT